MGTEAAGPPWDVSLDGQWSDVFPGSCPHHAHHPSVDLDENGERLSWLMGAHDSISRSLGARRIPTGSLKSAREC